MFSSMFARCFLSAALLAALPAAQAFDARSTSAVNVDGKGLALRGFDPVAYFSAKTPTPGDEDYKLSFEGATYYFASKENWSKFKANPAAFAPQFGGFCANAVAKEKKVDADPKAWRIVDGKLYVTANPQVLKDWQINVSGNLKVATEAWQIIRSISPNGL